ncbi:MAG: LAGLIDADG family homing endonuclease, partial [Candidatus Omnitrophota bacterium]
MYLVGLIITDGNLSKDGRHIDITSKDYEFFESTQQTMGIKNRIGIKYGHKQQKAFRIQIANIGFYEFLVSLGLTKNKFLTLGTLNVQGCIGMARKNILAEPCVNSHQGWMKSKT